ncbi:hypothetical protein [Methanobacterium ferruginis]|uniref:hypothetical protein n=1 Tax=Methanobacterium ferruginis TaxID=710191 RepID=UPI00257439D1|nr:hypothetical protein [Methanobacterium ferruginis]BDZ67246.1 hypothetical protein GCM10025860_06940 [Methanobacterium ferruginis]
MGDIQNRLDELQEEIKTTYKEIMEILEDKYCWKCPMRTTSMETRCREIHAGRVILKAVDEGIAAQLLENQIPWIEVEALILRMFKRKIKNQGGRPREKTIIFKVESEQNLDLTLNSWLMVKINPRRVRVGDEILIPIEPVKHPFLGSYALLAGFPFQITHVKRVFHEGAFWYVIVENERVLPMESVLGVLIEVLDKGSSLSVD